MPGAAFLSPPSTADTTGGILTLGAGFASPDKPKLPSSDDSPDGTVGLDSPGVLAAVSGAGDAGLAAGAAGAGTFGIAYACNGVAACFAMLEKPPRKIRAVCMVSFAGLRRYMPNRFKASSFCFFVFGNTAVADGVCGLPCAGILDGRFAVKS
jgi:hypothetical protein